MYPVLRKLPDRQSGKAWIVFLWMPDLNYVRLAVVPAWAAFSTVQVVAVFNLYSTA